MYNIYIDGQLRVEDIYLKNVVHTPQEKETITTLLHSLPFFSFLSYKYEINCNTTL